MAFLLALQNHLNKGRTGKVLAGFCIAYMYFSPLRIISASSLKVI